MTKLWITDPERYVHEHNELLCKLYTYELQNGHVTPRRLLEIVRFMKRAGITLDKLKHGRRNKK